MGDACNVRQSGNGSAGLVGIDGLTLEVNNLTVELNQKAGGVKTLHTDTTFAAANNKVIDFAASFDNDDSATISTGDGLKVLTGPSSTMPRPW